MRSVHTTKSDPRIAALSNIGLFEACTRKELAKIASLTTEVERSAGTVLCKEGTGADECAIVLEGAVSVTVGGKQVAVLGEGSILGELALIDPGPRTATVTAQTPLRMLVLSRRDFTTLIYSAPDVVRRILVTVARRLRQAEQNDTAMLTG